MLCSVGAFERACGEAGATRELTQEPLESTHPGATREHTQEPLDTTPRGHLRAHPGATREHTQGPPVWRSRSERVERVRDREAEREGGRAPASQNRRSLTGCARGATHARRMHRSPEVTVGDKLVSKHPREVRVWPARTSGTKPFYSPSRPMRRAPCHHVQRVDEERAEKEETHRPAPAKPACAVVLLLRKRRGTRHVHRARVQSALPGARVAHHRAWRLSASAVTTNTPPCLLLACC